MFGGGSTNPYDEIVGKTTDENLTSENWELILNLCDKVSDDREEGARNVIAAILKRLAHRNPNVQLYALSLTESLSKNCGLDMNREIASKAFTQGLEKLVTDRNTHDRVKKRVIVLVAMWTAEFENDASLGVMEDCYNNLKAKGFKFESNPEPLPPTVDDDIRRKEEEELQRVLELSMQDRGGRNQWPRQYSSATSSSSQPASSSLASQGTTTTAQQPPAAPTGPRVVPPSRATSLAQRPPRTSYPGGYAPAKTPSPVASTPVPQQQPQLSPPRHQHQHQHQHHNASPNSSYSPHPQSPYQTAHQDPVYDEPPAVPHSPTSSMASVAASAASGAIVTRVRALHTFEPTEPGELAFDKGDVIRVVDRGYKDWWRGQLKGRTGIFPVNYVEPMPEPTVPELAREAEQEAAVFTQAVNVEKLLNMLKSFDPGQDNLADNEEIQELYRSCMALRPKIVKLIDKYSQKRADLVSMNETFVRARVIFDRMMEESLARHTGIYDTPAYPYTAHVHDPRGRVASPPVAAAPQPYGSWNAAMYDQPGYNAYTAPPPTAYPGQHPPHDGTIIPFPATSLPASGPSPTPAPQPYHDTSTYVHQAQGQGPGYSPQAALQYPAKMGNVSYSTQGPAPYAAQPTQPPTQPQPAPTPAPQQQPPPQAQVAQAQVYQQQKYHVQQQPPQGYAPPAKLQGEHSQGYYSEPHDQQPQQQQGYAPPAKLQAEPSQGYYSEPHDQQPQQQPPAQAQVAQPQFHPQVYQQEYHAQQQQQQPQQPQEQAPHPPTNQTQVPQSQAVPQSQPQTQAQVLNQPSSIDTANAGQAQPHRQQQQQAMQGQAQQMLQGQGQGAVQGQVQVQTQVQAQQPQQTKATQESQGGTTSGQSLAQGEGPPYVFDPHATYADPNVQAWAQYYAQGGTDPAGAVYFISVPGVKDGSSQQAAFKTQQVQGAQQQLGHGQGQFGSEQSQADAGPNTSPDATDATAGTNGDASALGHNTYGLTATTAAEQGHKRHGSQTSYSSLANATSYGPTATAGGPGASAPVAAATTGHTVQTATTGAHDGNQPSWVLPKAVPDGVPGASSPPRSPTQVASAPALAGGFGTDAGSHAYQSLPNQFAGISVADQQQHY